MLTEYALNPQLKLQAEAVLDSSAKKRGLDYIRSPSKRKLDLLIAGPSSVLALPVIAFCGLAILAHDGRNPLLNVGEFNPLIDKYQSMHKIRTMVPDSHLPENNHLNAMEMRERKRKDQDPRITKIGRLLRKTSVDELPQLFDVLKGDLTMVGPRFPKHVESAYILEHKNEEPYQSFLCYLPQGVKFGLTGMYGIFGRANLDLHDQIGLEVLYMQEANFISDIKIIALSIPTILSRKGAI